jgi:hypothetical protein
MSRSGGWAGNRERMAATWARKQLGKRCFAPFTGQDWRAYNAWIHCLELFFGCDAQGEEWALEALRCCVSCAQPKCWPIFKGSIPAIGDWSHEEQIWTRLELVAPTPSSSPPRHPRTQNLEAFVKRGQDAQAAVLRLLPKPEGEGDK